MANADEPRALGRRIGSGMPVGIELMEIEEVKK